MKADSCLTSMLALIARRLPHRQPRTCRRSALPSGRRPKCASVGDDPFGKLAKYGDALMIETPGGPDGRAVAAVRRKQSHLKAGSGPMRFPLTVSQRRWDDRRFDRSASVPQPACAGVIASE
jgi:hypothetical protein